MTGSYVDKVSALPAVKTLPAQLAFAIQQPQNMLSPEVTASLTPDLTQAIRNSLAGAINSGFMVTLGLSVVILVLSLFMPNIRVTKAEPAKNEIPVTSPAQALTPAPVVALAPILAPAPVAKAKIETRLEI